MANAIIKDGSGIKYDTLLSIIKQRDRIVRENLMLTDIVSSAKIDFSSLQTYDAHALRCIQER